MKKYTKPEIEITAFSSCDIITVSGGLINKGENGTSPSESFGSMFGTN